MNPRGGGCPARRCHRGPRSRGRRPERPRAAPADALHAAAAPRRSPEPPAAPPAPPAGRVSSRGAEGRKDGRKKDGRERGLRGCGAPCSLTRCPCVRRPPPPPPPPACARCSPPPPPSPVRYRGAPGSPAGGRSRALGEGGGRLSGSSPPTCASPGLTTGNIPTSTGLGPSRSLQQRGRGNRRCHRSGHRVSRCGRGQSLPGAAVRGGVRGTYGAATHGSGGGCVCVPSPRAGLAGALPEALLELETGSAGDRGKKSAPSGAEGPGTGSVSP